MSTRQSRRALRPTSVRAARAHLLGSKASALVEQARLVLCEPTRTQIVRALAAGPLSVSELASVIGCSQSTISRHLRILREEGVVQASPRGRVVLYRLTPAPVVRSALQALDTITSAANT